jgi:hypothetical protein
LSPLRGFPESEHEALRFNDSKTDIRQPAGNKLISSLSDKSDDFHLVACVTTGAWKTGVAS